PQQGTSAPTTSSHSATRGGRAGGGRRLVIMRLARRKIVKTVFNSRLRRAARPDRVEFLLRARRLASRRRHDGSIRLANNKGQEFPGRRRRARFLRAAARAGE